MTDKSRKYMIFLALSPMGRLPLLLGERLQGVNTFRGAKGVHCYDQGTLHVKLEGQPRACRLGFHFLEHHGSGQCTACLRHAGAGAGHLSHNIDLQPKFTDNTYTSCLLSTGKETVTRSHTGS